MCATVSLGGLAVGLYLALISVTLWGKIFALSTFAFSTLPLVATLACVSTLHRRRWKTFGFTLSALLALAAAGFLLVVPDGQAPVGSPVQQRFSHGQSFPRYNVANLEPEIEQINLGLHLIPFLDNLFTPEKTHRLTKLTLDLYQEMDRDPNFRALGSAMGGAYADLLGFPSYPPGHYYLYIPRSAPPGPLSAIVFLHGSAGNFKIYTWVWSQLAEQLGCVIIAPSFGFGNWDKPGGIETVRAALADAETVVKLDSRRIFLAGLSNGGLGVCAVANALPRQFCACIFISPVMTGAIVTDPAFQTAWKGRPMLILTGEDDERIPVDYVRKNAQILRAGSVNVDLETYPGEDHFLIFSQRQSVLQKIAAWMQAPLAQP